MLWQLACALLLVVCKMCIRDRDYTGDDGYLPAFPAVPGKYTYREVLAPEGYELCVTELAFEITPAGEIEGKTAVADDYTRFSILKVDEYHKPLAGVEFGLFREDGTQQASAVSDEKGLVTFEKIPYGTYTVQETKSLTGYLKNFTKVPITIDGTFVNPKAPIATLENCQAVIVIQKVDQNNTCLLYTSSVTVMLCSAPLWITRMTPTARPIA